MASFEVCYRHSDYDILTDSFVEETNGKIVFLEQVVRKVFKKRCGKINSKEHWAVAYERSINSSNDEEDELEVQPLSKNFHTCRCRAGFRYIIVFHPAKNRNIEKYAFHVEAVKEEDRCAPTLNVSIPDAKTRSVAKPSGIPNRIPSRIPDSRETRPEIPTKTLTKLGSGQISEQEVKKTVKFVGTSEPERPLKSILKNPRESKSETAAAPIDPDWDIPTFNEMPLHSHVPPADPVTHPRDPEPASTHPNMAPRTPAATDECTIRAEKDTTEFFVETFIIFPRSPTINTRLKQIYSKNAHRFLNKENYIVASVKKLNQQTNAYEPLKMTQTQFFQPGENYLISYCELRDLPEKSPYSVHIVSIDCKLNVFSSSVSPECQSGTITMIAPYNVEALVKISKAYFAKCVSRIGSEIIQVSVLQTQPVEKELYRNDSFTEAAAFEITFVHKEITYNKANKFNITIAPSVTNERARSRSRNSRTQNRDRSQSRTAQSRRPRSQSRSRNPAVATDTRRAENTLASEDISIDNGNMINCMGVLPIYKDPVNLVMLKLPCPKTCGKKDRTWTCNNCNKPVYYDYNDHLLCQCGCMDSDTVSFKCSEHNNYVSYEKGTLVKKLRKRYNPKN
uniref:Death domain-containing protein n=1 Tax=Steinernema glaseri TaxID=37863 RepID=A0A1I7ZG98_9BILA